MVEGEAGVRAVVVQAVVQKLMGTGVVMKVGGTVQGRCSSQMEMMTIWILKWNQSEKMGIGLSGRTTAQ